MSNIEANQGAVMKKSYLLHGIESTIEDLRNYKEKVHAALLKELPEGGTCLYYLIEHCLVFFNLLLFSLKA